jgi:hypothetical protein
MDWVESGVFCSIRDDGCKRNNEYSNRGTMFSKQPMLKFYKQDN